MSDYQMISPTVNVYDDDGKGHTVFGWYVNHLDIFPTPVPVVGDPDGPGIGTWTQYYGDDPWHTKP